MGMREGLQRFSCKWIVLQVPSLGYIPPMSTLEWQLTVREGLNQFLTLFEREGVSKFDGS